MSTKFPSKTRSVDFTHTMILRWLQEYERSYEELFMASEDPVTLWYRNLHQGDEAAFDKLWGEFFEKLVEKARYNIHGSPLRVADEEDIALSAMHSFVKGIRAGRFDLIANRDELWKLLVTLTLRKISKQRKYQRAKKRGEGQVRGESVFNSGSNEENGFDIEQIMGNEPTPELVVEVNETCDLLMDKLGEEELKMIAGLSLEGYTNNEIAAKIERSERTVERKLRRIRNKWANMDDNQ